MICVTLVLLSGVCLAQDINYDESRVPEARYRSPLPKDEDWNAHRREILSIFESEVYGQSPAPADLEVRVVQTWEEAVFDGRGIRTLTKLGLGPEEAPLEIDLLTYRPAGKGPHGLFLGLNFYGNQAVYPDASIPLARGWVRNNEALGIVENVAINASRGSRSGFWPIGLNGHTSLKKTWEDLSHQAS